MRPGPDSPPYVTEGDHFEAGDVVGLLEVMKMFNPIHAGFAGTVKKVLVSGESGVIVHKGQPLLEVEPDAPPAEAGKEEAQARRAKRTRALVDML